MRKSLTRRSFLETGTKTTAGVAALSALSGCTTTGRIAAAPARRTLGANDRINIAAIGCGGMCRTNLKDFMKTGQCSLVALCDVDQSHLDGVTQLIKDTTGETPTHFKDYRRVIDLKDVDAVVISTPDHWHAIPMIAAAAAGKDVYVEKPCCHNIKEGRAMVDAACKYKAVVQVGTHQRSAAHMQQAIEFIRSGKLGTISMTETYTYGNEAPDGMGHEPDEAVPPGVDYDMWLGPAPLRPFNKRRFHFWFRWYFDYAAGMVGDWNVHLQDITMWALDTPFPSAVSTSGGKLVLTDDRDTPDTMLATYEFKPGPYTPRGHVHLYTMRKASGPPWSRNGYGMVFHGTNGKLHITRKDWEVIADAKDWNKPDQGFRTDSFKKEGVDQHYDHVINFLDCMRSRRKPIATIEEHFKTVTACHLANVSIRSGRKLFWNPEKELCYKDAEMTILDPVSNNLLTREYRKGYELPQV